MPKKSGKSATTKFYRPPIVTLMGHVDHGKTSLLDVIRNTRINITSTESGGITQHTGAYSVERNGKKVVFIDTPGHEAFTQMRARGGAAADIVVLVVAADDGVMPQTKEAIMHAKAAKVPIIVAINKIDLPGVKVDKVKKQLAQNDVLVEGYGGDVVAVEVSATENKGIEDLLDVISLIADMNKTALEAKLDGNLEALIIEAKREKRKGVLVQAVVKNGKLRIKDDIIASPSVSNRGVKGRVKAIIDFRGHRLSEAVPGDVVEILGFNDLPMVGDVIRNALHQIQETSGESKSIENVQKTKVEEQPSFSKKGGDKLLNIVVRADTLGTLEAVVGSLRKLRVDDARVNILFEGTGDVKESDILLASTGRGIVVVFRTKADSSVLDLAKSKKVIVHSRDIIYRLVEDIGGALEGILELEESKIKGKGLVIQVFTLPKSNMKVAGTLIEAGKFKSGDRVGIYRGKGESDTPLYVSRIRSIHEGAKEVSRSSKGTECGLLFKPSIDDIQLDDRIEVL